MVLLTYKTVNNTTKHWGLRQYEDYILIKQLKNTSGHYRLRQYKFKRVLPIYKTVKALRAKSVWTLLTYNTVKNTSGH